jgi:hypothetical protein
MTNPPANGATYTTKELIGDLKDDMAGLDDRLRRVEIRIAILAAGVPILTAGLSAVVVKAVVG